MGGTLNGVNHSPSLLRDSDGVVPNYMRACDAARREEGDGWQSHAGAQRRQGGLSSRRTRS